MAKPLGQLLLPWLPRSHHFNPDALLSFIVLPELRVWVVGWVLILGRLHLLKPQFSHL